MGLIRYELGTAFPGVIRRTTERLRRARGRLGCRGLRQVRMIVLDDREIANWAAWEQHPPDRLAATGHAHGRGSTGGRKPAAVRRASRPAGSMRSRPRSPGKALA